MRADYRSLSSRLLQTLRRVPTVPLSTAQLAIRCGASHGSVKFALAQLVQQGIITRVPAEALDARREQCAYRLCPPAPATS